MEQVRCSSGKVCYTKKKADETLWQLQHGDRKRKTYRKTSRKYSCDLCGMYHLTSQEFDKSVDGTGRMPLILWNKWKEIINKNK